MWKQAYFWFSQPTSFLLKEDNILVWFFAFLLAAGLVLKIIQVFSKHQVTRNLWRKLSNPPLWIGILGLFWFLLRYELAPIFSARGWTLLLTLIFLIWFGFSIKYLIFNFKSQKQELDRELLNRRYIPGAKK
jgi:hypothetical protein